MIFAAVRDAVGEEPIATGGWHLDLEWNELSEP